MGIPGLIAIAIASSVNVRGRDNRRATLRRCVPHPYPPMASVQGYVDTFQANPVEDVQLPAYGLRRI